MIHRHRVRWLALSVPPGRSDGPHADAVTVIAPRLAPMSYWCVNHHRTAIVWSTTAQIPAVWVCRQCGQPAGRDKDQPPPPPRTHPHRRSKTPLAHLRERRSEDELDALLNESLAKLRGHRRAELSSSRDHGHNRSRP